VMRRSLLLAFVSIFSVASVALAATGTKASKTTLVQAVDRTSHAATLRYVMDISMTRPGSPALSLHVNGVRGRGSLFIHVRALADAIPGPQQSALLDGPFLYEGSPNGVAIAGKVRWLRLPVARIGLESKPLTTMRDLSPAPLLRIIDEWAKAKTRSTNGVFHGTVAYDDPIVLTALGGLSGGVQFRDVWFSAKVGADGYVHSIRITGKTADGRRVIVASVHLFAFDAPVTPRIPGEGTFVDQKLIGLAE